MQKERIKILLIVWCVAIASCAPGKRLIPTSREEVLYNPYGAFITVNSDSVFTQGELLEINNEHLLMLTATGTKKLPMYRVTGFDIVLCHNQQKLYSTMMAVLVTPAIIGAIVHSEFSGNFLALGAVILLSSGGATVGEYSREAHIVTFGGDRNNLHLYAKYARFPGGLPKNVDPYKFTIWWANKKHVNMHSVKKID